jgi:hypothetical protein
MTTKNLRLIFLVIIIAISLVNAYQRLHATKNITNPTASPQVSYNSTPLSPRTKVDGCQFQAGLPDPACTPGAIDPAVTEDTIQTTICQSGYTKTVRPPVTYTDKIKRQEMIAYGFTDGIKNYELDHLVPLELGGSPADEANLWPEPASPTPGFHEKDAVENYLHTQVCSGKLPLLAAQSAIAHNWVAVLQTIQ